MNLGEKLKKIRTEFCLSQEQLSEVLCVSRQAITKWENNVGMPDTENLKNISKLFNVSVDYLLGNILEEPAITMKENYDINNFDKSKYKTKYLALEDFIKTRYPDAIVYQLSYTGKSLDKTDKLIDFATYFTNITFVFNQIYNIKDLIKNTKFYYLVDKEDKQLLITFDKDELTTYAVRVDTSKRSIVIDDKEFIKLKKSNY